MAPAPGARAVRPLNSLRTLVTDDPTVSCLAEAGKSLGLRVYAVGGGIRDWLLGRTPPDWDIVVPGDPAPLVDWLRRHAQAGPPIVLDAALAIVRVHLRDGRVLDIARLTEDDLGTDLARRDLTFNAIALDVATGEVHDPLAGYADLVAGSVRACGRLNLEADPLRLIRVFRFAAALEFTVDGPTAAWCAALAPRLAEPAGERLAAEWHRLLAAPDPVTSLDAMGQLGLLGPGLGCPAGDLPAGRRAVRELVAFLRDLPDGPWRRLSAWLDAPIAGERTRRSALLVAALAADPEVAGLEAPTRRLRWSRKETTLAQRVLAQAQTCRDLLEADRPARAWHRFALGAGEALPAVVTAAGSRPPALREEAAKALTWCWAQEDAPPRRLVDGHTLMRELGLPPGPHLARLLAAVEEEAAVGALNDGAEAVRWAAQAWRRGV